MNFPIKVVSMYIVSAVICCTGNAWATTLSDSVMITYRTNPSLQAQRQALKAIDENYVQVRANLGPVVSLNSQFSSVHAQVEQPGSFFYPATTIHPSASTGSQALSITQLLFDGGKSGAAISAAEADILSARQQLRQAEISTIQKVIAAFVGVRRDQALLDIARDELESLAKEDVDTQNRFRVHEVTLTDRAQAKARLSASLAAYAVAQSRLAVSRSEYFQVVGVSADSLEAPPELSDLPVNIEQAFDVAERINPELLSSKFAEQSSRAQIKNEKAANNVVVTAVVDFVNGPLYSYDSNYYSRTTTAKVVVSKPLYSSGMVESKIRASVDRNSRDRLQVETVRRNIVQNVALAWSQVVLADTVLAAQVEQVASQKVAYDSVRAELKAGLRSTIEVLNAEHELQAARQAVIQIESDRYIARASLLASTGLLRPEALAPDLKLYSPERAFRSVAGSGLAPWIGLVESLNRVGSPRPPPLNIQDPAGEGRPDKTLESSPVPPQRRE